MDNSALMKYAAAAGLIGSVFYLVLSKSVDSSVYVGLVSGALGGLGIVAGNKPAPATQPAPQASLIADPTPPKAA